MILRDLHHPFKIKTKCDKFHWYNIFWEFQKVQRYAHKYVSSLELVNTDTKKKEIFRKCIIWLVILIKNFFTDMK